MKKLRTKIIFWFTVIVLFLLFVLTRTLGPRIIDGLYQEGAIELLNRLSGVRDEQSLDYYLGRMEDVLLGPLGVTFGAMAFILFSLRYLSQASMRVFGLAVFVYLLITKWEVLFFPPYGDAIGGPFAEAIWLARNSFDYVGLSHQPGYIQGGPKVYLFSLYPTFLAVLIKLIPAVPVFLVVNHLIVFSLAAGTLALFRSLLLKIFDPVVALLTSILFLSLPLFQSQAEAINMEMFCVFFAILSVYHLANRQFHWAGLTAVVSAFIKDYGTISCVVVFLLSLTARRTRHRNDPKNATILCWGLFALGGAILKIYLSFLVTYFHTPANVTHFFSGWKSLKQGFTLWLYISSMAILGGQFVRRRLTQSKSGTVAESQSVVVSSMLITAGLWFLFFLNFFAVSPRYSLFLYPFLIFCVIFALTSVIKVRGVLEGGLIAGSLFSFLCSYGLVYKPIGNSNYVVLERSLEYRNDLKLNQRVVRELEEKFTRWTIGAPFLLAQMLKFKELGYVHRDLDVMIYGHNCTYGDMKTFLGLKDIDVKRTLWVAQESPLPKEIVYPIDERDKIVKQMEWGNKKVTLFLGGVAIERMRIGFNILQRQQKLLPK